MWVQYRIELLRDEEQGAFDNTSKSIQQTDKGQKMEDTVSTLDDVVDR